MKYLKIIVVLVLLLLGGFLFFFRKKVDDKKSTNATVNDVINFLDNAFDKLGTFDKHLNPIFDVLEKLNKTELELLHNDFGVRNYNPITRFYGVKNPLFDYFPKKDLNALFDSEFDLVQLKKLKDLYNKKGLSFPYLSRN